MANINTVHWILIVEDDADFSKAVVNTVEQEGYKTMIANRLSEALKKVANQRYDCILLDLHLEQGDGKTVIEHIRGHKHGFNYTTPVIVMSGHLDEKLVTTIGKDVKAILVKPFSTADLLNKIKTFCPIKELPPKK